jgi:putative transposase
LSASGWGSFLRKLLKSEQYVPRVLVTDKLRSYGAAKRDVLRGVEHRQSKYLNNRAENSHERTRLREHAMRRFSSPRAGRPVLTVAAGNARVRPDARDLPAQSSRS